MSDFEHFAVHKSADSLSVHKARMARPRFAQESQATEDEEDELDFEEDQPDSPAPDTEVQARVDSIALAQKRLTAKSSEKSKFDSSSAPKSRFGRVKLPEESEEPASDEKKIKTSSGKQASYQWCPLSLSTGYCVGLFYDIHHCTNCNSNRGLFNLDGAHCRVSVSPAC